MAAEFYVGSFTKTTSTGTQAVTGIGFRPKAIQFWTTISNRPATATLPNQGFGAVANSWYGVKFTLTGAGASSGISVQLGIYNGTIDEWRLLDDSNGSVIESATGLSLGDGDIITTTTALSSGTYEFHIRNTAVGHPTFNPLYQAGTYSPYASSDSVTTLAEPSRSARNDTVGIQSINRVGANPSTGTWVQHINQSIGFTSGPAESYAIAGASWDNLTSSDTYRRFVAKAICLEWNTLTYTRRDEADISSFDSNGFTIDWTSTSNSTAEIMFFAIGGDGVSAKVVNWTSPTSVGNKAVTGVGFMPDAVLHIGTLQTALGSAADMRVAFGCMTAAGGQFANGVIAEDNTTGATTGRQQDSGACFSMIPASGGTVRTSFASMDTDGFTTSFSNVNASAFQIASLCLKGVTAKAGEFVKTTGSAPIAQSVVGIGFRPKILLTSFALPTVGWSMGATDGTRSRVVAQMDLNAANPTQADSIFHNDKAILGQTTSGNPPTTTFAATLTSFDSDGFTINFSSNDATGWGITYLAFASLPIERWGVVHI